MQTAPRAATYQASVEPNYRPDYKAKPHPKPEKWRRPSGRGLLWYMNYRPTTCALWATLAVLVPVWVLTGDAGVLS